MARYAITILTIGAIIFIAASGAGAAPPQEPKELTVLAYNTHLWYDSAAHYMCDLCNDFLLHIYPCCDPGDFLFEDEIRREYIVAYIIASGADIVVLQEVWAPQWQQWFAEELYPHGYEYAYFVDSSCDSYFYGKDTLSNGLVLLSKWPLSNERFRDFPTYFPSCFMWEFCDHWANKGVLTADVDVNGVTIRIGVSHAIGDLNHEKGSWPQLWTSAITPFQLNGETYMFSLDNSTGLGIIVRMEDYGRSWDEKNQKYNYGAGWKPLWYGPPGFAFDVVTSFELDGHPYLFTGSNTAHYAYIFRINEDPSTGLTPIYEGEWDVDTTGPGYGDLAAWYRFEGDVNDSSDNGKDGTTIGGPTYSHICKERSYSILLDGEDDYVEVGSVGISGSSPRTVAGWVRATKPAAEWTDWTGIFGFTGPGVTDTHFDIQRRSGQDYYCIHVYNWEENIIPLDMEWHHLAATYDGSTIAWYANGSRVGSAVRAALNTNDHVQIGKRADRGLCFPGLVDDVRIYSRALSQDEIGYLAGRHYNSVTSFELDGHPYIFTHSRINDEGHIFRINDDPCTGWSHTYRDVWSSNYATIVPFELNGHPYIFTHSNADQYAYIKRINDDPCTGWSDTYEGHWFWGNVESFELDGHPYLFVLLNTPPTVAHIFRINDDPCTGWTLNFVDFWDPNEFPYFAVKSFEMNGHPYLFAKRNCCEWMECEFVLGVPVPLYPSNCDSCNQNLPGEAYLKRINDDPNKGWENLNQLEEIKIIRDRTVVDEDGPPAIMMGDFNVHRDKYGIMNELFGKAGAVDAYIEVHGTDAGGETGDLSNNKLAQYFCPGDEEACDPDNPDNAPDRVDYVYVRQSGAGLRLVPTEAHVFRDWKYDSSSEGTIDLSDHFPLFVKFKIFEGGCTARAKGDLNCDRLINFADYAILASAWMSGPNDISWDGACDMSDPADDVIDTKDVDVIARSWLTMPVHNVTRNTWYGFIQAAIDDAGDGDEIQVAPGTYYEAINFNGKAVRLYSSGGPEVTTIDPKGIGGAYHVVQCVNGEDANTILEGFTITGGNADGPDAADKLGGGMYNKNSNPMVINCTFSGNSASRYGGGMYNSYSSPTVTGCTFTGNSTTYGGGMYNYNSSPTVTNCTFSDNSANADGGGMYNVVGSPTIIKCTFSGNSAYWGGGMCNRQNSPTVTNCTFSGNSTTYGGGMYNYNSSPTVTNCTFSGNTAVDYGGGMCDGQSSSTVTNCTFSGNTAVDSGGGMCNVQSSSPTVTDCIFSDNEANGDTSDTGGGGMRNLENSNPTISNCTFINNKATSSGGGGMDNRISSNPNVTNCTFSNNSAGWGSGMFNGTNCSPKVTNCTFSINSATGIGGGMYNLNESSPTVTNCTFSGNSAGSDGGGMDNRVSSDPNVTNCTFSNNSATVNGGGLNNYYSNPTVTNCVLWGNTAQTGPQIHGGSPTVTYSDIQGALWPGTGNINSDPCFVDADSNDLRLLPTSPCVDTGNTIALPPDTADLDGDGDTTEPIPFDLDGGPRVWNDIVDMGAYEYLSPPPPISTTDNFEYMAMICANWLDGTKPEL